MAGVPVISISAVGNYNTNVAYVVSATTTGFTWYASNSS